MILSGLNAKLNVKQHFDHHLTPPIARMGFSHLAPGEQAACTYNQNQRSRYARCQSAAVRSDEYQRTRHHYQPGVGEQYPDDDHVVHYRVRPAGRPGKSTH